MATGDLSRKLGVVAMGLDLIGIYGLSNTVDPQWVWAPLAGVVSGIATVVLARRAHEPVRYVIAGLAATAFGLIGLWLWVLIVNS